MTVRIVPVVVVVLTLLISSVALGGEKEVKFKVDGLDCARSEMAFVSEMEALEGVKSVKTDYADESATVLFDDEKTNVDTLKKFKTGDFKIVSVVEVK